MQLIAWSYDLAREQWADERTLTDRLERSAQAGYNALGLYLEHRFAYASAPWAAAPGALTPDAAGALQQCARQRSVRIIPLLNTLGHMEGFIRSEAGAWLAEGPAPGALSLQMCATREDGRALARGLVADVLEAFDDEWVHLGGDETRQLGQCPRCAARVADVSKAGLYAEYYGPLCRWVLERGRRPCLWGDMLIEHPEALHAIPRETVIFDWHYEQRPGPSTAIFRQRGYDVVCCPALRTYDASWCHGPASAATIDAHAEDARQLGALGVCLTTWECCCFSEYESVMPLIYAAGRRLARAADWSEAIAAEGGAGYVEAARLLGAMIPQAVPFLSPGSGRRLRDRLVIRQDPFQLWRDWRDEACGDVGDTLLALAERAAAMLPDDSPLRFPCTLHAAAVRWVRHVEQARRHYANGDSNACLEALQRGAERLGELRLGLTRVSQRGGSEADLHRLDRLLERVRVVCARIAALPRQGAWRPAFETLLHPAYLPGAQAAWETGA
jgi:hypothetical protein